MAKLHQEPLHHHDPLGRQLLWVFLAGGAALGVVWLALHFRHLDPMWTDNLLIRLIEQAHGGVK